MDTILEGDGAEAGRVRYRRWPLALKRRIVEETLVSGASVSVVARRYDVNANQVFAWRKQHRTGLLDEAGGASLLPVRLAAERAPAVPCGGSGSLEVEFPAGIRVRVVGAADASVIAAVLRVLVEQ